VEIVARESRESHESVKKPRDSQCASCQLPAPVALRPSVSVDNRCIQTARTFSLTLAASPQPRTEPRPPAQSSLVMGKRKQPSLTKKHPAVPKRAKNHKTTTNPREAANPGDTYEVEKIVGSQFDMGLKKYEVKWVGFEKTTLEPLANLVDATGTIKTFEDERRKLDADAKAAAQGIRDAR
jgi:hypothetical protein